MRRARVLEAKTERQDAMFTEDRFNNIGRLCSLHGDTVSRRWRVKTAVVGYRYLVRHLDSGEHRVVDSNRMTSLY